MIKIPVSHGELIDKLSILEVKKNKIIDLEKLKFVELEYNELKNICKNFLESNEINDFYKKLIEVNTNIWDIEETLRKLEAEGKFDSSFVLSARGAYKNNDLRFFYKNEINKILNSEIREQKSHNI
jgi:hypothetical protein